MKTLALSAVSAAILTLTACDAAPVLGVETTTQIDAEALESMRVTLAKSEIIQLAHAYGIARDNYDGEAYASVFAEDGVFMFRGEEFVGREAIAGRVPPKDDNSELSMHFVTTSHVEMTSSTTAKGKHYGVVYVGEYAPGAERIGSVAGRLGSRGVYNDSYVLTGEGWKISQRAYTPIFIEAPH